MSDKILNEVSAYYSEKVLKNGTTPQGVDWNSLESQEFRFGLLSEMISKRDGISVLDYGCGFGAMYDYLKKQNFKNLKFIGYDISTAMIDAAQKLYGNDLAAEWYVQLPENYKADYVIASGIFNVKQETSNEDWKDYMLKTLQKMNQLSTKGFSFNVLTKYSDKEFMKDNLYYADPLFLFDYCKTNFSKYVALKHDYPLYEFTIVVKK
jgi:SAM-dependent methyltransferase